MFPNIVSFLPSFPHLLLFFLFLAMIFMGEETLLVFGALARIGYINFWDAFLIAAAGGIVGDLIWFRIGEEYGEKFVSRYGRWLFMTPERFKKLEDKIKKRGGLFIFFSKYLYNMNHISLVAAGTIKFDFERFIKCDILAIISWVFSFLGLGYYFANNLAEVKHDVRLFAFALLAVFVLIILVDKIIGKIVKKWILGAVE
jgi:membrane protein DedA with SNARE-associated domain